MTQSFSIIFITLFPNFIESFFEYSIIKKAINCKKVEFKVVDLRDFGIGKHKKVDDYQYGPGKGMVLRPEPIYEALQQTKKELKGSTFTILVSPRGKQFKQSIAQQFVDKYNNLILISGNYEGFDERICDFVDSEISVGDYVLTGGELPALTIANAVSRLVDGVIKEESRLNESFRNNLLDYPVYTKPLLFKEKKVPEILLSGNHKKIQEWRKKQAIKKTKNNNPDLFKISKKPQN